VKACAAALSGFIAGWVGGTFSQIVNNKNGYSSPFESVKRFV
jgi:hypothetical protein